MTVRSFIGKPLGYRPPTPEARAYPHLRCPAIGVKVDRRSELTSGWANQWGQANVNGGMAMYYLNFARQTL